MKLLRENMFYSDPKTYAYTDIAEDLPGPARAIAPILKNVLPSAAIISKDPAEREKQIDEAIQKIKNSKKSKSKLLGEMMQNVTHLAPEAAKAGLAFSALTALLGVRSPFKQNSWKPQLPFAPISAIKKLLLSKAHVRETPAGRSSAFQALRQARQAKVSPRRHINHIKATAKDLAHGALYSGAYAAGTGALIPAIGGNYELSDQALQEAKEIMQKDPYITSLPASEMLSAIRQRKSEEPLSNAQRVKNTLLGTGLGTLTALPPAVIPGIIGGLGRLAGNSLGRIASKIPNTGSAKITSLLKSYANSDPITHGVGNTMLSQFKKDIPNAALFGGGVGALSGALSSNNPVSDEYENLGPH
jgi:hypothetical protein